MAVQWGSWAESGNNGMRLGVDVSYTAVTPTSPTCTTTFKVYTENRFAYSDGQTLTYGGTAGITGTLNFQNSSTTGQQVLRDTKTWVYTYPSNGASVSRTFTATLSGAFNGVTPTVTVTATPPARLSVPVAVTNVVTTRNSDTQAVVTWTNPPGPVTTNTVRREEYFTGWTLITPPFTSTAPITTLTSNSLRPNMVFRYSVGANNTAGSGPLTASNLVFTTPAAPSGVQAVPGTNGSVRVSWTITHPRTDQSPSVRYTQQVERSGDSGQTWAPVATGLVPTAGATSFSWTDAAPLAGKALYRVTTTAPNGLVSAAGVSNEVGGGTGTQVGSKPVIKYYVGPKPVLALYAGAVKVWPEEVPA